MRNKSLAQRLLVYSGYSIVILSFIAGVVFFFWSAQNKQILEAHNLPFPIRPGTNSPGSLEIMTVDYCKKGSATGTVVAKLVGTKSVIRIPWADDTQRGQCLKTDVPVLIPEYAVDDTYHFEFDITYRINPVVTRTEVLSSQNFVVKGTIKIQ